MIYFIQDPCQLGGDHLTIENDRFSRLRSNMVKNQLIRRGIADEKVLEAFNKVPRHLFVNPEQHLQAYENRPLPIPLGQTISQPYIVALMTESLELHGNEKVLDIGTGSGYQTAILAELADQVCTIERFEELSLTAAKVLNKEGYKNISFKVDDGTKGWPEKAPFDRILVAAASDHVPKPFLEQLSPGGRIVMPVGDPQSQQLLVLSKDSKGNFTEEKITGCRFLPLIGEE